MRNHVRVFACLVSMIAVGYAVAAAPPVWGLSACNVVRDEEETPC